MEIIALGYDRQSFARENKSVASPATQRAANKGKAEELAREYAREGITLKWLGHFSEAPGTSAFTGKARPEFNKILEICRTGRANMIIVHYISRLSREEPLDIIPVITELLNLGVTIVSVNEGTFRKGNLMDLIHLIMRIHASHEESKNKSVAIKGTLDLAKSLGGHVGAVPYGFDTIEKMVPNPNDGNKPIAIRQLVHGSKKWDGKHETEPEVIRWVWREIKRHKDTPFKGGGAGSHHPGSINGLVTRLWEDAVPTRGATVGKKRKTSNWDGSVLKRILRDPRIAGYQADVIYKTRPDGKRGGFSHYRIRRDSVTMRPMPLECGPIIPPAEWFELQEWLDGRGRGKGQHRGQSLLSAMDVLYCYGSGVIDPETGYSNGKTMTGNVREETDGPSKDSYACKCPRDTHDNSSCSITMHHLDPYVVGKIFARIATADGDEETLAVLLEAAQRWGKQNEAPEVSGSRSELLAERADAKLALEELYADRRAGGYKGPMGRRAFLDEEATLTLRMEGAEERLRELDAAQNPKLPIGEWLGAPGSDPLGPDSWWANATLADKRAFVKLFLDRIEVKKLPKGVSRPGRVPDTAARVVLHWATPDYQEDAQPETLAA
ncbi:recombinase family protein [Streptomyces californicus]|uniref:recombinase family protein n=1 Tax=Streptomyces TaxID=1883 RepID=UPI001C4E9753|nr:recombinase family protein [Streptomyces sp. CB04723]